MLIRIIALAALVAAPPLYAQQEHVIHVTGIGSVRVEPDIATLNFAIQGRSESPDQAKQRADAISGALVAALEKLGVASRDIRSTAVTLNPFVDRQTQRQLISFNRSTRVILRDLARFEDVERAALKTGVNSIGGVRFGVSNEGELQSRARDRALDDARVQAEGVARKLGLKLGSVRSVRVSRPQSITPQPLELDAAFARAAAPNYRSGVIEITASADIDYAIGSR